MNKSSDHSISLRPRVWHPKTCAHVRLLGPCFKTGRNPPLPDSSPKRYLTARPCIIILHDPEASRRNWGVSLHSERFHVLFTFFSKFFSSFPHGTCSLSVSREYLGLDGIYHPFSAAVPSNTTLCANLCLLASQSHGATTLYGAVYEQTQNGRNTPKQREGLHCRPQFPCGILD